MATAITRAPRRALADQDEYGEAIRLVEELLALRRRAQGADHPDTVLVRWDLDAYRKVAALPAEQRAAWRTTFRGALEARQHEDRGRRTQAVPLRAQRLESCRRVLGDAHPYTAAESR